MNRNWDKFFYKNNILAMITIAVFISLFFFRSGGYFLLFIFLFLLLINIVSFLSYLFFPVYVDLIDKSLVFYRKPNRIVKIIRLDQNPEMLVGIYKVSSGSRYTVNYNYYKYIAFKDKEGTVVIQTILRQRDMSIFEAANVETRMNAFKDFDDKVKEYDVTKPKFDDLSAKLGI